MIYSAIFQGPWGVDQECCLECWHSSLVGFCRHFPANQFWPAAGNFSRRSFTDAHLRSVRSTAASDVHPLQPGACCRWGCLSWIAFTISFAFGKMAYLWPVISDPFGWGWNLFGTAGNGMATVPGQRNAGNRSAAVGCRLVLVRQNQF